MKTAVGIFALVSLLALAAPADAKVYKYAFNTSVQSVTTPAPLMIAETGFMANSGSSIWHIAPGLARIHVRHPMSTSPMRATND